MADSSPPGSRELPGARTGPSPVDVAEPPTKVTFVEDKDERASLSPSKSTPHSRTGGGYSSAASSGAESEDDKADAEEFGKHNMMGSPFQSPPRSGAGYSSDELSTPFGSPTPSRAADYSDYSTSGAEDEDDIEDQKEFMKINSSLPRRQTWSGGALGKGESPDGEADGAAAEAGSSEAGTGHGMGLGASWRARVRRSHTAPRSSMFKGWGHQKKGPGSGEGQ